MNPATRSRYAAQRVFLEFEPDGRILSWDNRRLGCVNEYPGFLVARHEATAWSLIDRPEARNALTAQCGETSDDCSPTSKRTMTWPSSS